MNLSKFDYFTYWLVVAIISAVVFSALSKMAGGSLPSAGVFIVASSVLLGILGNHFVSQACNSSSLDQEEKQSLMQTNFWLHVLPLLVSIVILCAWRQTIGGSVDWGAFARGVGLLAAFFAAYLIYPLSDGSRFLEKMKKVYLLGNPIEYVVGGVVVSVGTALLLVVHGHNLRIKN